MAGLKPCAESGCPVLVVRGCCQAHSAAREQSRSLVDVRRLYRTARWSRMRAVVLGEEPVCRDCLTAGSVTPATDVDHIVPHRGDLRLFWGRENLQALCHACHSSKTARGE